MHHATSSISASASEAFSSVGLDLSCEYRSARPFSRSVAPRRLTNAVRNIYIPQLTMPQRRIAVLPLQQLREGRPNASRVDMSLEGVAHRLVDLSEHRTRRIQESCTSKNDTEIATDK
jgi:hypothetical protein